MAATSADGRWGDLRLRVLSAAVLAPLALGCIWIGGVAFAGLIALVAIGLAYEWLGLCRQRDSAAAIVRCLPPLPLAVVLTAWVGAGVAPWACWSSPPSPRAAGTGGSSRRGRWRSAFPILAWARSRWSGCGSRQPSGGANVIVLLLIVWASDIGAYMAGRAIGGPRLAPAISPGKTWSGAVGGLVAAAAIGLRRGGNPWQRAAILASGGLRGADRRYQPGRRLFESQLKRHFGVKDSGTMIPGHGGLLDRLDALLTAAPAAALLALILSDVE